MNMSFYKYQGTGNDFIIIDNRALFFPKSNSVLISNLCDRHYGIGADGLILLENDKNSDFKMVYFNADGNESTMCGNGGRCIVAFAQQLQLFDKKSSFLAIDGIHHATIDTNSVSLQMIDVSKVCISENSIFVNTGSPHHIEIVDDIDNFPVIEQAKKIINCNYSTEGCNINFVEQLNDTTFKVRTYERGVEDETLACGTGATAVAIAMHKINKTNNNHIKLKVLGGDLEVKFTAKQDSYSNIVLSGSAQFVFKGTINL